MHDEFSHRYDDFGAPPRRKWLPLAGGLLLVSCMAGAGYALIATIGGAAPPQQPTIQQITLVTPPPPPPPPPEVEQPPEPEPEEIDIPEPQPEPIAEASNDEPPPGDQLGLDADGSAGSDGFGLAARKGGRGLLGGDPHAWYAGVLQRDLQMALSRDDAVRKGSYSVEVRIRVGADGTIAETALVGSTENPTLDAALRRVLESGLRISRTPPDDLPQPIRLRISSRG